MLLGCGFINRLVHYHKKSRTSRPFLFCSKQFLSTQRALCIISMSPLENMIPQSIILALGPRPWHGVFYSETGWKVLPAGSSGPSLWLSSDSPVNKWIRFLDTDDLSTDFTTCTRCRHPFHRHPGYYYLFLVHCSLHSFDQYAWCYFKLTHIAKTKQI